MPLIFGAEIAWVAMISAVGAYMLYRTETMWLRPLVQALQHPHGAWWKRVVLKAAGAVAAATLYVEHKVRLALSHYASGSLHLLTRWFNSLASSWHFLVKEFGEITTDVAHTLGVLIHHTIPHMIRAAVRPVERLAHQAYSHALAAERFAHALEKRLLRGIDRLAHRLEHVVLPRLRAAERAIAGVITRDLPALRRRERALEGELRDQSARLKRIEKALGLGILAGLVYKVLARVAPWLFCRNVNKVGKLVCGMNPDTLTSLTALLLGTLAIRDLETLARYAASVEEDVAGEVKNLLGA
jgi:hypothetical protein